jgi:nucleoside-diphosphate-sugar epimerase
MPKRACAGSAARGVAVSMLRIPASTPATATGGHPRERLLRGTPVLRAEDDVYTNHIHADDLARACVAALHRGKPQRVLHASDDTELRMGDYFDLAADLCGLPRPPRISRAEARRTAVADAAELHERIAPARQPAAEAELRLRLRYPTVHDGLLRG